MKNCKLRYRIITQKKGHSCFENIFSFNMEILKWDYITLIKEKYNCLNNCLLEWSHVMQFNREKYIFMIYDLIFSNGKETMLDRK